MVPVVYLTPAPWNRQFRESCHSGRSFLLSISRESGDLCPLHNPSRGLFMSGPIHNNANSCHRGLGRLLRGRLARAGHPSAIV